MDIFIVALLVSLIQLSNAYLRYLPFSGLLSSAKRQHLFIGFALWTVLIWLAEAAVLDVFGLRIFIYKALFLFGWFPYFLLAILVIPRQLPQHIFILGMQAIFFLCLQTLSINLSLIAPFELTPIHHIEFQAFLYLLLFLLLLPITNRCFRRLLPSRQFISEKKYGYYVAFLPLCIFSSHLSFVVDNQFHSWTELSSRLLLILCFFLLYRYLVLQRVDMQNQSQRDQDSSLLHLQLSSLQDHTLLVENSQKEISILRHDMRHRIRLLYTLIEEGHNAEAREILQSLDDQLENTVVRPYCQNPIINAALSIYISKAQKLQIPVEYKIDLPEKLPAEENDFAILLANLIENAILASLKQAADQRAIHLQIRNRGQQILLQLENRFSLPLELGTDGLPQTRASGHGIGMRSLAAFQQRYDAILNFEQDAEWVRVLLYWATKKET